jgi:hypothetical protein
MLSNIFIHPILVLISLSTATGVLVHDTRIDKMAVTALSTPVAAPNYESINNKAINFSTDLHTHTERHSLSQIVNDLKTPNPRLQPRGTEDKKHLTQRYVPKGQHIFDNYNLPLV